ncbi:MAG: ROK family protein [Clostridia bacterium]|nr:ROK family protein [Clostridia bacterium]
MPKASVSKENKKDFLKKCLIYINAIRQNGGRIDKAGLKNATGVAWPTLDNAIKKHFSLSYSPIKQNDNEFILDRNYSILAGISIGATQIKLFLCDFYYEPLWTNQSLRKNLSQVLDDLKLEDIRNNTDSQNNDVDWSYFCYKRENSIEGIVYRLEKIFNVLLKNNFLSSNLLSIGISFPGIINSDLRIDFSPNIKCLRNINIKDLLSNELWTKLKEKNIPVHFEHDTQAALIYEKEHLFKSNKNWASKKNVCCVYMAAGIGTSLIIDNTLYRGTSNSFGELGHTPAPDLLTSSIPDENLTIKERDDKNNYFYNEKTIIVSQKKNITPCECGKLACLENAFRRNVFDAYDTDSYLDTINNTKELNNFHINHPYRYRVLKEYLGYIIGLTINLLNPDMIIFSGRIMRDISKIGNELNTIKANSAIGIPAAKCQISLGSKDIFSAAAGAAISSLHCCIQEKDFCEIKW